MFDVKTIINEYINYEKETEWLEYKVFFMFKICDFINNEVY